MEQLSRNIWSPAQGFIWGSCSQLSVGGDVAELGVARAGTDFLGKSAAHVISLLICSKDVLRTLLTTLGFARPLLVACFGLFLTKNLRHHQKSGCCCDKSMFAFA